MIDLTKNVAPLSGDETLYERYSTYYHMIGKNGPYEIKTQDDWMYRHFIYEGELLEYDQPGNIVYGFLGLHMGYSEIELLMAAGAGQVLYSTSSLDYASTFFDDPADVPWIKEGFRVHQKMVESGAIQYEGVKGVHTPYYLHEYF